MYCIRGLHGVSKCTVICLLCTKYEHSDYFKRSPTSVSHHDYRPQCDADPPDRVTPRRIQMCHQRGALPIDQYFRHHGKAYDCNKITWYDEVFNGRRMCDQCGSQRFSETRRWAMTHDAWKPEKSDYPLQGLSVAIARTLITFHRPVWDRGTTLSLLSIYFFIFSPFTIHFLSLALLIFFFCPSLPFLFY